MEKVRIQEIAQSRSKIQEIALCMLQEDSLDPAPEHHSRKVEVIRQREGLKN